jgi:hypothetical protein
VYLVNWHRNSRNSISEAELARLAVWHDDITTAQQALYRQFRATGQPMTIGAAMEIEITAMTTAGLSRDTATSIVRAARTQLEADGVDLTRLRVPGSRRP